jgi:hypothetical protein
MLKGKPIKHEHHAPKEAKLPTSSRTQRTKVFSGGRRLA